MATTIHNLNLDNSQLLVSIAEITAFVLAGKARISIHLVDEAIRFSYQINVAKERTEAGGYKPAHGKGPWKVSVRTQDGWAYLGEVVKGHTRLFFNPAKRRRYGVSVDAEEIFATLVSKSMSYSRELPSQVQVWRSEHCGRCGMDLISEFRHIGYGPVCCGHLGIDAKAILQAVADMPEGDSRRVEVIRDMVVRDLAIAREQRLPALIGGVAGDYLRGHQAAM